MRLAFVLHLPALVAVALVLTSQAACGGSSTEGPPVTNVDHASVPRCRNLARELAHTIVPGPRALVTTAGPREFVGPTGGARATVPAGWVMTTLDGSDFRLHRFRLLTDFPGRPPFLTIYVGPQAETITPAEDHITGRRQARVFGQRVTWVLQDQATEEGPPIHEADTITTVRGRRVQLSIQSLDPAALDAAIAIASSIR